MADGQYGISEQQKQVLLQKHARRIELRKEFQKLITNPHNNGEGGYAVSYRLGVIRNVRLLSAIMDVWFLKIEY